MKAWLQHESDNLVAIDLFFVLFAVFELVELQI